MNCPVCQGQMTEQDFGGVMVDVCKDGCKGMWFDWNELIKLDETNEGLGKALQESLNHERTNDADRGQVPCPKCGIPMHIHRYQSAKEVNVDECYQCGGFFLDSGELLMIRENFMSEAEEEEYMNKLLADMPSFDAAQKDLEHEKQRLEATRKFTRFMRLSYYVKGK